MMKKFTFFLFAFCLVAGLSLTKAQGTATATVTYSGFQACGGCTVCGSDYWCFNTMSSYCGNTAPCGTSSFTDPVPPGNIVTNIQVQYYSAQCSGGSLTATINGNSFPTVNEGNAGCLCSNNPCGVSASTTNTFPCGVPNYNYGTTNSLQLCTGSDVCINKLELIITYAPANQSTPAQAVSSISGNSAFCPGTSYTYSTPGSSNASSYSWTVPAGWTINSGQGTTSINVTAGATPGNVCVTATNLCGSSAPYCYPVSLSTLNVAATSASSSPGSICPPQSSTLTVNGGTLGAGADWTWYSGSCGGAVVGTGSSIVVSPASNTTYYVAATGGCNTTSCVSTQVTVGAAPAAPVSVNGSSSVCASSSQSYSVAPVSGATSYTWSVPAGATITSGQGTNSIALTFGSTSGNICVTASNSCGTSSSTCLPVTLTSSPATPGSISGSSPVCPSGQTYSIGAVSGASSYTWSATGGSITGGQGTTSASILWTSTGTQTVAVTASNSCGTSSAAVFTVTVDPQPTISVSGTNIICAGQSTSLTAAGATNYSWNTGANTSTVSVSPGSTTTYTVTGTTNPGCSSQASYVVNVNQLPNVTITGDNSICIGESTTLTAGGANSFSWNTGSPNVSITDNPTATTSYTVTGTDANNCQNTASVTVTVNALPAVTVPATQTLTCSNPTLSLNGSANPANSTLTWSNSSGFSSGNPATVSATGYYVLTATTPAGCSTSDSVQVVPDANVPNISVTQSGNAITCATTSLTLTGNSTTGGVTFSWADGSGPIAGNPITVSSAGSFTLTVTNPSNGCTSTQSVSITNNNTPPTVNAGPDQDITCVNTSVTLPGSTSAGSASYTWSGPGIVSGNNNDTAVVNTSGTYTLSVTDAGSGCTNLDTVSVNTNTTAPNANGGADDTLYCSTPQVTLVGTSSTNGTTYEWFTGGSSAGTNDSLTVSGAGTYILSVTDTVNGCVSTDSVNVYSDPNQPVISNANNLTIDCNNTQVTLNASSGAGTTLEWNGTGIPSNSPNGTAVSATGNYTVTATSSTGCISTATITVGIDTLPPTVDAGVTDTITCAISQASLNGSPSTGVTYVWSGPAVVLPASQNSTATAAGTYTLTVTSTVNGCSAADSVVIAIDTIQPTASAAANGNITCTSSQASITGSSGTGDSYAWSGPGAFSSNQQTATVGSAGTYSLTVTDTANGCSAQTTVTVNTNTTVPSVNAGANDTLPCGNGTVTLNGTSATGTATFAWSGPAGFSSTTAAANVTSPGQYVLTVTDTVNGCTASDTVDVGTMNVVAAFGANPSTGFVPLNVTFSDSSINATGYVWTFGDGNTSSQPNPNNIYTSAGTFTVMLIASNSGCQDTATAVIIVQDNASILIPNVFTPNGDGINDLFMIQCTGIKELHADIFNRWGEKVFQLNGPQSNWDGKTNAGLQAANGTYFIMLKATGYDGTEYSKESHIGLFR